MTHQTRLEVADQQRKASSQAQNTLFKRGKFFAGASPSSFDGGADGFESGDVERGQGHGLRGDGADLAANALQYKDTLAPSKATASRAVFRPVPGICARLLLPSLLSRNTRQLVERGQHLPATVVAKAWPESWIFLRLSLNSAACAPGRR